MKVTPHALTRPLTAMLVAPLLTPIAMNTSAMPVPENLETLGHIQASLDGKPHEWVTIRGEVDGETGASAYWQGGDSRMIAAVPSVEELTRSMGVDPENLKPQERRLIEHLRAQQQKAKSSVANSISLNIQGHDSDPSHSLHSNVLSLTPREPPASAGQWKERTNRTMPADITYVLESAGGMPRTFYTTAEDMNAPGHISFRELSFDQPTGQAAGTFEGRICRVEMRGLNEVQQFPDDCMKIEGSFETGLHAETR